ncbi:glycosyltransferase [Mediterraneibacter sp. ICN-202921]|uniref:glycosyltransferase n=1 Tax=Mediterraneibacter sp. ICN-202921 TaxID=3134657 RepID=UPI0030C21D74
MKKVKVLLLISDLGMGGAENITINIAQYIDQKRFDVKIISMFSEEYCVDKYKAIIEKYKIPVIYLNKKPGLDLSIIFKLRSILKKEKPDVLHTHRYSCVYALLPSIICRVPGRVHTVHNVADKEIPGAYRKLMKIAYHFFGVTAVAINEGVKDSIRECYKLAGDVVPIIKNGVDITKFYSGKKASTLTLINVGRFSPQKNHKLLIKCMANILKENKNIKLVLIGEGELKNEIEQLVSELKLNENVHFTGNVSNVEEYLAAADIYVMTSDYEGLPLSVIEAMAAGLPIVTTKAGGVVNLVKDGQNGILVDVGDEEAISDAVLNLIKDSEKRQEMGEKSQELAKEYSVERMVEEYEKLYLKLRKPENE